MSKKFQLRRWLAKRKNGFNGSNGHTNGLCPAPKNPHEEAAEKVVMQLCDEDSVFTFARRNNYLDREGLDWVLGRHVRVSDKRRRHSRELRIHIQHKASESAANKFRRTNPSLPVWVHHASMTVLEGKINLLNLVVNLLESAFSPYAEIFKQKLSYFEDIRQEGVKTAS